MRILISSNFAPISQISSYQSVHSAFKKSWLGSELDQIFLISDTDENFCMGGPGMIMSRETLKRMAPFIEECLVNLYTTHEDVEIGRCVKKFAGVSCTWNYEVGEHATVDRV